MAKNTAHATGLFIDFIKANSEKLKKTESRATVLQWYSDALIGGTINIIGDDLTNLWWEPKSFYRAKELLDSVTRFSDWLVNKYATTKLNPWKNSSVAEQLAYWRRFDRRRSNSILAHTAVRETAIENSKTTRLVKILRKTPSSTTEAAKYFPEEKIIDLIFNGFLNRTNIATATAKPQQIRDALITTLLHGAGLRESEPFHIFVSDIGIDNKNPKLPIVRIYHPELGKAPLDHINPLDNKYINDNREQYLKTKYGIEPRNIIEGRFHAGWKDLQLSNASEKYTQANWFPSYWGELFLALFKIYINHARPRITTHPYLFVSLNDKNYGAPYTIDSYRQSHSRAVRRIGLTPCKSQGTTPHGHRHAYGQRMSDANVSKVVIQRAMNHKSVNSQEVYTTPSQSKIDDALREAQKRLDEKSMPSELKRILQQ